MDASDKTIHLWSLNDGCEHVIAAVDKDTALAIGMEEYAVGDMGYLVTCKMLPDDDEFVLHYPDGLEPPYPPGSVQDEEAQKVTAKASVWAAFCGNGVYVGGEDC